MSMTRSRAAIAAAAVSLSGIVMQNETSAQDAAPQTAQITIRLDQPARPISPDLFGIFFEDLNHAADGGLYAELIQNRSFDFQPNSRPTWNALTGWELLTRGSGKGNWAIDSALPIHRDNPTYVVLHVNDAGDGVGLRNEGFDGIAVKAGESYDVSFFARQLYMNQRWGAGSSIEGKPMPMIVRLESKEGAVLAEASLQVEGREWKKITCELKPTQSDANARFVVLATARGGVAMDEISLFPRATFRNRPNGLRADLAQALADLKPKFIRFPGGCLAHGNGLGNMYRWKDTIGPTETRKSQPNLWGYHQTMGLGYFEYFQFCEDIGAKPLPVVPAGVSCQNSGHTAGVGQQCLPMEEMPAYIQEVLDLIEWANGPATSTWGAKRAAAGHPEPFGLQYLGVGNEDHITPGFKERFKMIFDAVRAKHPEITVIGTVGPSPAGRDWEEGWKFANELNLPMVDEHYYESPEWYLKNLGRYDKYDRSKSKVYLGEYASRGNTLHNALAEAAYLTSLERNGDVVHLASYAPLLCKLGHVQWHPDLIYFTNTQVMPSVNYYVQQMFGVHAGQFYLPTDIATSENSEKSLLAVSSVRDKTSGDIILKLVNVAGNPVNAKVSMAGAKKVRPDAVVSVLSGDPLHVNHGDPRARDNVSPTAMIPRDSAMQVGADFDYTVPAHSFSVIRMRMGD